MKNNQNIGHRTSAVPGEGAERARPVPDRDLSPLPAGAATAVAAIGALLALTDSGSPVRGPFVLFFLLAAPVAAVAAALRGLDPFARAVASVAGAVALDMLVAQAMLAVHRWSVPGGVAAVTALSTLALLLVMASRRLGRAAGRQGS
ncbi:hypothetical protein [Streptomyces sp. NPDC002265]|uniref:hypothetical protein n=1 Tax=Streptomyces sp. NPDC002265 TaxID=3154415 RepID=UPI0033266C57